ncbi:hypothetical protein IGB42_03844 [Andreprevotia sp. IGB-42]|uniref:BamA/TamA family outer membrane protein n=1 Tax=Andreprevotia sp. IGB-42 TaxID=2497473 RepID=UPI001358CB4B|nr:BamA/TamA family outer membrane protein [Andreprevotia sp. IGB-42]KAF0811686.1 hypothetical protein IGB42_03844 [Andreprevotia sp. IGB-42]
MKVLNGWRQLVCTALLAGCSQASWASEFHDPDDGAFDVSDFLLNHKGALPVPTVITEPAVGYGGGLMLMYFDQSIAESAAESIKESGRPQPPNITGLGGMMTENGTWGAGAVHFHTWDGDRYRYLGAVGKGSFNLDFYDRKNQPHSYTLDGTALVQQLLARIGDSHWYAGARYVYFSGTSQFKGKYAEAAGLEPQDRRIGKGGLVVDYESRDNFFFPKSGSYAELQAQAARGWLGSTQDFETYDAKGYHWMPLSKAWVLGARVQGQAARGDVPFYALPYVDLRGVSRGRYQDETTLVGELEARWDISSRWSLLAFGGAGKAWGKWNDYGEAANVYSYGAGFRYLIARKLGLAVGMDIARGPDEGAFYFQVGSAWR